MPPDNLELFPRSSRIPKSITPQPASDSVPPLPQTRVARVRKPPKDYRAGNQEAARIILEQPEKYTGLMREWAEKIIGVRLVKMNLDTIPAVKYITPGEAILQKSPHRLRP